VRAKSTRTCFAVQVEVQVQVQQVAEDVQADASEGTLVDGHPQQPAQAVQQAATAAACREGEGYDGVWARFGVSVDRAA
jgi:hypothetical protein